MTHANSWATACEIKAACAIFHVHIVTFLQGSRFNDTLQVTETSYLNVSYISDFPTVNKILYLLLHNNHFQLLIEKHSSFLNQGPTQNNADTAVTSISTNVSHEEDPLPHSFTDANTRNFPSANPVDETSKQNDSSVNFTVNNSHPLIIKQQNYIPDEQDTFVKFSKLGIRYDFAPESETLKENKSQKRRNYKRIKACEKKYSVNVNSLPNPPPIHDDQTFNKATDAIRTFELSQMSLAFNFCAICKERRINMAMATDTICKRCSRDKNTVKMFSVENKMDPGPVPDELKNLSITEQQLICRVSPAILIHMLKHG